VFVRESARQLREQLQLLEEQSRAEEMRQRVSGLDRIRTKALGYLPQLHLQRQRVREQRELAYFSHNYQRKDRNTEHFQAGRTEYKRHRCQP